MRCARFLVFAMISVGIPLWLTSCKSDAPSDSAPAPTPSAEPQQPTPSVPAVSVDACAVLTQQEVEAIVGRPVLAPQREEVPQFSACGYRDPEAPQLEGRALSQIVKIGVMVGQEGAYFAGAAAQAKDGFEMAKGNAAEPETVPGLGDDAYWDTTFNTLNVVRGIYWVDVTVASDVGSLEMAKALAAKVLERLP